MKVDVKEYPKPLEWEDKVFSMPNIPRGEEGLINVLRKFLLLVQSHESPAQIISIAGSESKITLNEVCIRLRPMKLVKKVLNGWELTEESKRWLETQDNLYLAAVLCANIRFLGEILFYLDTPKKAKDLQEIAIRDYDLNWKTGSDINSRLVWLRQLGLVDFQEFSLLYSRTKLGEEFLNTISVTESVKIDYDYDETADEETIPVADWAIKLTDAVQDNQIVRKPSIGYIPGNMKDFTNTITEYVSLIGKGIEYDKLLAFSKKNYDIAASSLRSFMTTLSNIGMVERKTDTIYASAPLGDKWMESRRILDLVCIFQRNFLFVFELLEELREKSMSYKELAAAAKVSYGFEKENIDEIRKRIAILKAAKLVKNASVDKFVLTKRANVLLDCVKVQRPQRSIETSKDAEKKTEALQDFYMELRLSAKDSNHFERLEKNVKAAFEKLGFQAQWLGGSGKTDVLIHAAGAPKYSYTVAIDAKSTQSGNVTDNLVDFDTLIEHKKKHKANYSVIVGGNFQNERLIKRAIEHGVVLLDIETLEQLIRNHMEVPLRISAYKKIFEIPGIADLHVLDEEREKVMRYGDLLHAVMDCLIEESEDPVTGGLILERDIYRSLRNNDKFKSIPSLEEISSMLEFLASPLIACVEKTKDGYFAVGSLDDAAKKFQFYAECCQRRVKL